MVSPSTSFPLSRILLPFSLELVACGCTPQAPTSLSPSPLFLVSHAHSGGCVRVS